MILKRGEMYFDQIAGKACINFFATGWIELQSTCWVSLEICVNGYYTSVRRSMNPIHIPGPTRD